MHEAATSINTLEQHARKLQENGFKVEQWGKRIQEHSDQLALEHGQLIEECGRVIQRKAKQAHACTKAALEQEDDSPDLMLLITQAQLEARIAFIEALVIFAGMMQKRIKMVGKNL
ncbi:MAG: hypothetical protein CLLPBCKN_006407 [Chroococcidiopsis cubana SAG 39.79]|uniref:Uncharacterized protein n=1 Tax=Chroococcidiopsis cubana SAG 39.79 TaxID=388085 RepID=A0AB37UH85_9CYAN|nr:hypothetical protein [Chroococcidiopsis cubana]MDZ4876972.1 hypothetical protein [Chroococcidiopsis cubana SAG 39.79]PSB60800.1 hypothetical protein C7B79_24385 [Chroococcidiopsis cubana CCALA 043]RUT10725.1 hypothetical protein DSM107010_39650 [Chroococcidiopsis cubana SAG 39.79]